MVEAASYLPPRRIKLLHSAWRFAEKAHGTQMRRSGDPYITHPLTVATMLAGLKQDVYCLVAAILHDVIEDCGVTKDDLRQQFGPLVSTLVAGLSKLSPKRSLSADERRNLSLRNLLQAMSKDKRVVLIKLADRLHNIKTLEHMERSKQRRIARETIDIYAQIARRLGLYGLYCELADSSLKILYPWRYRTLLARVRANAELAQSTGGQMTAQIAQECEEAAIPVEFNPLAHSLYSYYSRWRTRQQSVATMSRGARLLLITDSEENCYRLLWRLHRRYKPRPGHFADFIALPKNNNYRSLHTQVGAGGNWALVVIRTAAMHQAAHLGALLNTGGKEKDSYERLAGDLQRLVKLQPAAELEQGVRDDLRVQRISVRTPGGQQLELPQGATALDCAFALDREKALSACGCWLDNSRMPLSTVLYNGVLVEIETSDSTEVQQDWLLAATTPEARAEVQSALTGRLRNSSRHLGRQMLDSALHLLGGDLDDLQGQTDFTERLKGAGWQSLDSLLEQIGTGERLAAPVASVLLGVDTGSGTENTTVIVGAEGLPLAFAACCNPLPGDSIRGEIRRGQGFVVHRRRCQRMQRLSGTDMAPQPLEWSADPQGLYDAALRLEIEDRVGVLAAVTAHVSDRGLNISKVGTRQLHGGYSIYLNLSVPDRATLMRLLRSLRTMPGIRSATRLFDMRIPD